MITKSKKAALVGTLALVALSLPMGAMAAQKFIVKASDGTTNKFVVNDTAAGISAPDNGYLGVGTASPTSSIHVIGSSSPRDAQIMLQHNPPTGTTTGGGGILLYYNNNGTLPSSAGERLGYIYFGSYDGTTQRNAAGLKGIADGPWVSGTTPSTPSAFVLETTPQGTVTRTERMRIDNAGNVGIGTSAPTSKLQVVGIPVYANNAAALAGGLTAGAFYRTGSDPDMLCIVH